MELYQTQTPINSGNSGGGLFTRNGHLIGINTMTQDKQSAEGLSFAISLETLTKLLTPAGTREVAGRGSPQGATMSVRLRRLKADYDKLSTIFTQNSRIRIKKTFGNPPEKYQVEYLVSGLEKHLDGKLQLRNNFMVEITLTGRIPPHGAAMQDADAGISPQHRAARGLHRRSLGSGRIARQSGCAHRRNAQLPVVQYQKPAEW